MLRPGSTPPSSYSPQTTRRCPSQWRDGRLSFQTSAASKGTARRWLPRQRVEALRSSRPCESWLAVDTRCCIQPRSAAATWVAPPCHRPEPQARAVLSNIRGAVANSGCAKPGVATTRLKKQEYESVRRARRMEEPFGDGGVLGMPEGWSKTRSKRSRRVGRGDSPSTVHQSVSAEGAVHPLGHDVPLLAMTPTSTSWRSRRQPTRP